MSYPNIKTPQGSAPDVASNDDGLGHVAFALVLLAVGALGAGLFIGWLVFSPATFERTCGTIEQCVVNAEERG